MLKKMSGLVLVAGCACSSLSYAAPLSTGVAPWLVNGNPVVLLASTPGAWVNGPGDGTWVGTTSQDGVSASPGAYTYSLNIAAVLGGAGAFTFAYAAADAVDWTISNGTLSGTTNCQAAANCAAGLSSLSGTFNVGSVLTATVYNLGTTASPFGLLVDDSPPAPPNRAPEPSSLALVALAGVALWGLRGRRRRGAVAPV